MIGPDEAPAELLQADQYAPAPFDADVAARRLMTAAWIVVAALSAGLLAVGFGLGLWLAAWLSGALPVACA